MKYVEAKEIIEIRKRRENKEKERKLLEHKFKQSGISAKKGIGRIGSGIAKTLLKGSKRSPPKFKVKRNLKQMQNTSSSRIW